MANFENIIQEINTNLPDNNTQSITAKKLRDTLIHTLYGTEENYDISANNNGTKYVDLTAALGTNAMNIPTDIRKAGMTIRFINSTTNKYEQYRYLISSIANSDFANTDNWQNVGEYIDNYETVVLTIGSADSSFNPVGQTITVTLEDGSITTYTIPSSLQISFTVQRGMRYTISGTSTADYRCLPISFIASIPTRYITMRYIPIATGVFILQKDGNYYLREEYDAETMAENAAGILIITSTLINAGFGIVLGKNDAYNSNTRVYVGTVTSNTESGYNGYNYTMILANAGDAPAIRCKNAMLELDEQTLSGFLPSYNEAAIIHANRQEISLCITAISGVELRYDGNWSTSSARDYMNIGRRFRFANGGYVEAGNSQLTRPCYIYPIVRL